MKVLSVVGDTPGWTYISEIFHEMLPASTQEAVRHPELAAEKTKAALEPILMERFSHQDFDFCFCFRCLDRDSGWVSKARLSKNDDPHSWYTLNHVEQASRSLGMDIVVYTKAHHGLHLIYSDDEIELCITANHEERSAPHESL